MICLMNIRGARRLFNRGLLPTPSASLARPETQPGLCEVGQQPKSQAPGERWGGSCYVAWWRVALPVTVPGPFNKLHHSPAANPLPTARQLSHPASSRYSYQISVQYLQGGDVFCIAKSKWILTNGYFRQKRNCCLNAWIWPTSPAINSSIKALSWWGSVLLLPVRPLQPSNGVCKIIVYFTVMGFR